MKRRPINPGPPSTRDEARRADLEALRLIEELRPLNRKRAAVHVQSFFASNPHAASAVAGLAFLVADLAAGRKQRAARIEQLFAYAWAVSETPERSRSATLAPLFGITTPHARRLARKLGLRK